MLLPSVCLKAERLARLIGGEFDVALMQKCAGGAFVASAGVKVEFAETLGRTLVLVNHWAIG